MMYILLIIPVLALVYAVIMLIRNRKVCKFRLYVNELCYQYNTRHIEERIMDANFPDGWQLGYYALPDYDTMLFSTKPLKLESWLSDEAIKKLTA